MCGVCQKGHREGQWEEQWEEQWEGQWEEQWEQWEGQWEEQFMQHTLGGCHRGGPFRMGACADHKRTSDATMAMSAGDTLYHTQAHTTIAINQLLKPTYITGHGYVGLKVYTSWDTVLHK